MLEDFFCEINFFNLKNYLNEFIRDVQIMAKNTEMQAKDNTFSNESSLIKIDEYAKESGIYNNILALDIGGTHTKVALLKDEKMQILLDENNDYFKSKSLGNHELALENFIEALAIEVKKNLNCLIDGVSVIWSNAVKNSRIEGKNYDGITGTTFGVGNPFYKKGEWFIKGLRDGYDLGDAFFKIFSANGLPIKTILLGNDTVFVLKALENADAGVVISSGSNATQIAKDKTITNSQAGELIVIPPKYLAKIDPLQKRCPLQLLSSGKWQNIFLKNYIVGASKYGIKDLVKLANSVSENNFLCTEDISRTLKGDFPYKEEFPEAEIPFREICDALMDRGALASAVLIYSSIVNDFKNGKRTFKIALDSAMARHVPNFLVKIKKNLEEILLEAQLDIKLLHPQDGIPVPILGAFNAIKKY